MSFPIDRPRRLRKTKTLRKLVRETSVQVDDLIQPLFVVEGKGIRNPISSLVGQFHLSPDECALEAQKIHQLGIPGIILFGIPNNKDFQGSGAWDKDGVVQQAVREIKQLCPDLLIITDVCLCEFTDHGHCGLLKGKEVDNDSTLELLARTAVSQAQAGSDIIAPSDMMDGRIAAIRTGLDTAGFQDIPILSYAAKFASAYYGPFRDAAQSAPSFGDRRGYQMDPANYREALREVELDLDEGADMVMVKPALPYLDILHEVKLRFERVTAAYQVSGEFAMVEAAAEKGLIDRKRVICESLVSIKRAGADFILTYWAQEVANWINNGEFDW